MQLCIFTEPQLGADYDTLLAVARATEDGGFTGFFRSDHYLAPGADGRPGPTDAWVTLGALARETSRVRLGTLMSAATFRLPGPLAITVAQVDAMSGGRVELGLGTGWMEEEHRAYGIPFPGWAERFARLEEQLEVVTGLWSTAPGERFSYDGRHYTLRDSPALPKPVQSPRPPVIVGGLGERRTPALAARFADELNVPFASRDRTATLFDRAREACSRQGRDPATLRLSAALTTCCGRDDREVAARAAATGRDLETARSYGLTGTPAQVVEQLGGFAAAGAQRAYLQVLDMSDLDHIALLASEVLPQVT